MLRATALVLGLALVGFGLLGIGFYGYGVIEILITRPADRSWLFWGLPLGLGGAISLFTGVGLLFLWRHLRRAGD